jgi:class 3 adenylate cyclase
MEPRSPDDYEREIASLRTELERLKTRSAITMFERVSATTRTGSHTILGLEEMVLTIGADNTVGYVNGPMMLLLGIEDRKAALGQPLQTWDRGPLGEGTLAALVEVARGASEPQALERSFPDLADNRLPGGNAPRGAGGRVLRFVATSKDGRVQIVVQDVTRTRWLEKTFARYVSPKVIDQMQSLPAESLLAMERREITILFCDLRGFTAMCQSAAPDAVQRTINGFLGNMVGCVEALDGTVQGFAGDEVMALFGAPLPLVDHALRALICAVEMQRVHESFRAEQLRLDLPAPLLGVGLATGAVVVGNIGAESRLTYTAQGHGVNLAARLCSAAAGGEVLTVPQTHRAALAAVHGYQGDVSIPRFGFASKGRLTFKNVAEPVEVLSVKVKS